MLKIFISIIWFVCFTATYAAEILNSDADVAKAFQEQCAQLVVDAKGTTSVIQGVDKNWLFLGTELRHIGSGQFWGENAIEVSQARNPDHADPLPAIIDFHDQLKTQGVELLIVPVPAKAIIYPDRLSSLLADLQSEKTPPRLDTQEKAFYDILTKHGIKVLDLVPSFMANRNHTKGAPYCRQDSHWSGHGCVMAAEQIANKIRGRQWYSAVEKRSFTTEWVNITIAGDLLRDIETDTLTKETLPLRRVGIPSGTGIQPVEPDPLSPVLLLGDSHNLVFHAGGDMHYSSAGLPDQLAFELGFPVDLVGVRGSGATPARINLYRRALNQPEYWNRKKIVVWCFSVREFTQSDGWRKLPIAP